MTKIADLNQYFQQSKDLALAVFRQMISNGQIEFNLPGIKLTLEEHDLRRIHDIINEIDDRRVFYDNVEDEIPEHAVRSILAAKERIHLLRSGLWANPWAEQQVRLLLHELGTFLTSTQSLSPPRNVFEKGGEIFEEQILQLRLKIWTIVAHFVVVFGPSLPAMHLPTEIFDTVKTKRDESSQDKTTKVVSRLARHKK